MPLLSTTDRAKPRLLTRIASKFWEVRLKLLAEAHEYLATQEITLAWGRYTIASGARWRPAGRFRAVPPRDTHSARHIVGADDYQRLG